MDGQVSTYRVVVSREDPWWVAVAYGPGLPQHGAATEARAIADLEETVRDLIVLRTDADLDAPYESAAAALDLAWEYNLPPDAVSVLDDYRRSKQELAEAQAQYTERALRAARVLRFDYRMSVRDVAVVMDLSHQRVSQLGQLSASEATDRGRAADGAATEPAKG
jgi:hypothetical protein